MLSYKDILLKQKQKSFIKNYFYFIILVLLVNLGCHVYSSTHDILNTSFWISLILIFIFTYTYFITRKLDYSFKNCVNYYLICISVLVFIIGLVYLPRQPIVFIYLIPVPLAAFMVNNIKIAIKSTLGLILLFLSLFLIKGFLKKIPLTDHILPEIDIILNIIPIISSTYCVMLISYYMHEFTIIKLMPEKDKTDKYPEEQEQTTTNNKFDNLYKEILDYFNEKRPYLDSNFNVYQLAQALNTNRTYISRALNKKGNRNFQTFVNEYRIRKVKNDLDNELHNRYTLSHIATKAGFKYQTTFNSVFKQIIGHSPSKYIQLLDEEKK